MTIETWQLIHGDALIELEGFAPASVDCVLTDPPYIIGGSSVGNPRAKTNTWPDMVNAAVWYRSWFLSCARALTESGYLIVFGNWRSLPTYLCAASGLDCLFPASCMVWDKLWIGPAAKHSLRPRYELLLWLARPGAEIKDRAIPDVIGHKWHGNLATRHPAEKPEDLAAAVLKIALGEAAQGKLVVDPFAGSATVGVAALSLGHRFHGIELDEAHAASARERLTEVEILKLCGLL